MSYSFHSGAEDDVVAALDFYRREAGQLHRLIAAEEIREDSSGPRDIDPADWADLLRTTE